MPFAAHTIKEPSSPAKIPPHRPHASKRATMSDGSGPTTYSYDSLDRLTSKATPEGTLTYGYDAARRVAPVPVIFSNQDEGAPGPSLLGTGDTTTIRGLRL